jgi:uncharacterized protein (DUF1800 family)
VLSSTVRRPAIPGAGHEESEGVPKVNARLVLIAATALFSAACGGGGGADSPGPAGPTPPAPPPVSRAEAFQLLNQASFGATEAEARRVMNLGVEGWIDDQLTQPASLQLPRLLSLPRPGLLFELQPDRVDAWFDDALHGDDQLRQRVAFALSEIFVVSQNGALVDFTYSLADYYDVLARDAFGNFRDLLEAVTLHPAMGVYLSMLGNEKPNPASNIRPDENYARELMQLFTIGLVKLNPDGTPQLDGDGQPVPTFDQSVVEGFAHVFTGWTYANVPEFHTQWPPDASQFSPMQLWSGFHDTGAKTLLDGYTLAAGQTGMQDLEDALDDIFNHPNVGPFIATRLIQRLVTSNPSPSYVARVAGVFDDNGAGVRGDLGAVVKAILTDPEARPATRLDTDGKIKEPLLRLTQLWRAYSAKSDGGRYPIDYIWVFLGQGPLQSPSVFNFFTPTFAPPGEIRERGLVAPELQIATEYLNTFSSNFMFWQIFYWNWLADRSDENITEDTVLIDYSEEAALASDVGALVSRVADKLLAGEMSDTLREQISNVVGQIPADQGVLRAAETIYLVVTSPEYAYQR